MHRYNLFPDLMTDQYLFSDFGEDFRELFRSGKFPC